MTDSEIDDGESGIVAMDDRRRRTAGLSAEEERRVETGDGAKWAR
jgi:hypothetical protein